MKIREAEHEGTRLVEVHAGGALHARYQQWSRR